MPYSIPKPSHSSNSWPPPAFQLRIYPATQQKPDTRSHHANGESYVLTKAAMHWFTDHYLRSDADVSDWRADQARTS